MTTRRSMFGNLGLLFGSLGLLLALVHFWAGPFAPQPTIESTVASTISSIRTAALDAFKGKEPVKETWIKDWDADTIAYVATAVLGGLALILGVISFARSEATRVASGAIALGASAITFQFMAMYAMVFLGVILIIGIFSALDIDIGF